MSASPTSSPKSKSFKIQLPQPMPHQVPIMLDPHRFKVLSAGRRWGKTKLGLICVVAGHGNEEKRWEGAVHGKTIWWVAPTYPIASMIWRDLKNALKNVWLDKREDERWIELPGGGSITVRSGENPDGLRGVGLDGVVLDEAAYMKREVWTEALRPALSDKQGWAIFISTPSYEDKAGESWFHELFEYAGTRPAWTRWQRPTSDNTIIAPEELEDAKAAVGELVFRQEYMAEFMNVGMGVFKPEWFRSYSFDGQTYYLDTGKEIRRVDKNQLVKFITVDLAVTDKQTSDYTVVATWGITPHRDLLLLDMIHGKYEGPQHASFIYSAFLKWQPSWIGIEAVAYQLTLIQQLQLGGALVQAGDQAIRIPPLPVRPLKADKNKNARALVISAFYSNGKVYHPSKDQATFDLAGYEKELISYPKVRHDDRVDAAGYAGIELSKPFFSDPKTFPILLGGGGVK